MFGFPLFPAAKEMKNAETQTPPMEITEYPCSTCHSLVKNYNMIMCNSCLYDKLAIHMKETLGEISG